METKAHHGNKWMPIMYATYYGIMKTIAEKYGYAIALHGTMTRDLDLIAIPWIDEPKSIIDMMHEFNDQIGESRTGRPYTSTENKPHGRVAYTLATGGGGYIDLSVMPTLTPEAIEH